MEPGIKVTFPSKYSFGKPTTLWFEAIPAPDVSDTITDLDGRRVSIRTKTWSYQYAAEKALEAILRAEVEPNVVYVFPDGSSQTASWERLDREPRLRGDDGRRINHARWNAAPVQLSPAADKVLQSLIHHALRGRLRPAERDEITQDVLFRLYDKGTVISPKTGRLVYKFSLWTKEQLEAFVRQVAKQEKAKFRRRSGRQEVLLSAQGSSPSDEFLYGVSASTFGEFDPEVVRDEHKSSVAMGEYLDWLKAERPLTFRVWAAFYGEHPYYEKHKKREIAALLGMTQSEVQDRLKEANSMAMQFAVSKANPRRKVLRFKRRA